MSDERRIDQDQADKEQAEFMGAMKPWTAEDQQMLLAAYDDYGPMPAGRSGARIMYEPKGRLIVLEIKLGDKKVTVTQSLAVFVKHITRVGIDDIWSDCGLTVP